MYWAVKEFQPVCLLASERGVVYAVKEVWLECLLGSEGGVGYASVGQCMRCGICVY